MRLSLGARSVRFLAAAGEGASGRDMRETLDKVVGAHKAVMFMKGTKGLPAVLLLPHGPADPPLTGLELLAFPCNQFGGQEPGTSEEIVQFFLRFCCGIDKRQRRINSQVLTASLRVGAGGEDASNGKSANIGSNVSSSLSFIKETSSGEQHELHIRQGRTCTLLQRGTRQRGAARAPPVARENLYPSSERN